MLTVLKPIPKEERMDAITLTVKQTQTVLATVERINALTDQDIDYFRVAVADGDDVTVDLFTSAHDDPFVTTIAVGEYGELRA